MSTEARFSPMNYPSLRGSNQDRLEAQGHTRGHSAGYAAGMQAAAAEAERQRARIEAEHDAVVRHGQAKVDRTVAVLNDAVRALNLRTAPVLVEAHDTLAAAAIELAETIICFELADGDASAQSALTRALADVDEKTVQTVRMNPADVAALDVEVRERSGVKFTPDASLGRGDAVTEFPDGYLDARIRTALARAKTALLGGAA